MKIEFGRKGERIERSEERGREDRFGERESKDRERKRERERERRSETERDRDGERLAES